MYRPPRPQRGAVSATAAPTFSPLPPPPFPPQSGRKTLRRHLFFRRKPVSSPAHRSYMTVTPSPKQPPATSLSAAGLAFSATGGTRKRFATRLPLHFPPDPFCRRTRRQKNKVRNRFRTLFYCIYKRRRPVSAHPFCTPVPRAKSPPSTRATPSQPPKPSRPLYDRHATAVAFARHLPVAVRPPPATSPMVPKSPR